MAIFPGALCLEERKASKRTGLREKKGTTKSPGIDVINSTMKLLVYFLLVVASGRGLNTPDFSPPKEPGGASMRLLEEPEEALFSAPGGSPVFW